MASRVKGLAELQKKIQALPKDMRKKVDAAIDKGAAELLAATKRNAPVDSGELRDSLKSVVGDPPGKAVPPNADGAGAHRVSVFTPLWYSRFVEHGTRASTFGERVTNKSGRSRIAKRTHVGTAPNPYFWPAYRALRKRIQNRIIRAAKAAVKEAAGSGSGGTSSEG